MTGAQDQQVSELEQLRSENAALRARLASVPEIMASRERLRALVLASEPILRHPARYDFNPPSLEVLARFSEAVRALSPSDREPLAPAPAPSGDERVS